MPSLRQHIATWSRGLALNALAAAPALPQLRNHLHCPAWNPLPTAAEAAVALAAIDLALTSIHIWWHSASAPPYLHSSSVHHKAPLSDMNYTVGQQFGLYEPIIGTAAVWTIVLILGLHTLATIIATSTVLLFALWSHTPPRPWHRYISQVFVTPTSHIVHHSPDTTLYDRNCAFVFSFWDKLFHTAATGA